MSAICRRLARLPPYRYAAASTTGRDTVAIHEVGPRDGLQNEAQLVATAVKRNLVRKLIDCGLTRVEVASFVSAKRVPQMGDARALLAALAPGSVRLMALVPNARGLSDALEFAHLTDIAVFAAASETFSQRNISCSRAESLTRFADVIRGARAAARFVRGYLSCVCGCPYEGAVSIESVVAMARQLCELGCDEIALSDTIGVGTADRWSQLLDAVIGYGGVPVDSIAIHCHDTNARALENIMVAVGRGVRVVDASVAGLGGCPFAPGASGNVATERVVYRLHAEGFRTGVSLQKLHAAGEYICEQLGRV